MAIYPRKRSRPDLRRLTAKRPRSSAHCATVASRTSAHVQHDRVGMVPRGNKDAAPLDYMRAVTVLSVRAAGALREVVDMHDGQAAWVQELPALPEEAT